MQQHELFQDGTVEGIVSDCSSVEQLFLKVRKQVHSRSMRIKSNLKDCKTAGSYVIEYLDS